ncbi:universal stress protein [Streptomyces sp. NBC_00239]|uniref:universal stress protein n=1 Tax=Streptomyces sp. NBC_00239 TaxID=2903640 RepID=UPI002E2C0BAF|nr:universal stress protein [Streptomyces sp. NBC_00239]
MAAIVVGVDGSPAADQALRWAAEEAALRNVALRVVHCWSFPYSDGETAVLAGESVRELLQRAAEDVLDVALRAAGTEPASVERRVVHGSPAEVLIEEARDATLLVVGYRGRGGFARLLLGSVSQQCAQHAPCPVVIVRG